MADNTWSSAGDTDGNTVGNWSLGALAATDNLIFDATSTVDCTFSGNITCAGFSMPGGYTGTIDMNTRTFDCTGNWTFGAAAIILPGASLITFTGTVAQTYTSNGHQAYDITINRTTATSTMTFSGSTLAHTVVASATNTQAISWTGTTMTVSGDLTLNGSGALNLGTAITLNGASSKFTTNSTVGTTTATSCVLTMNTATAGVIDVDKTNVLLRQVIITDNSNVTMSGTAFPFIIYGNLSPMLQIGDNVTFTLAQSLYLQPLATCSAWTIGTGSVFNVSGASTIYIYNPGTFTGTITIPRLVINSGTLSALGLQSGGGGAITYDITGAVDIGTATLLLLAQTTNTFVLNTNNNAITCGIFRYGSNSATNTFTANIGSSIINCSEFDGVTYNSAAAQVLNFQGTWNCTGAWAFGSNHTINPGTSTVTITNTSTVTSNGKSFYNFAVSAAGKTITLADDLTIATGGGVTVTAFTAFAGDKYIIFAGSGSITISTAVSNRLRTAVAGSTITWNTGANVWTVPAYAASDWGPAAGASVSWVSSVPGTAYRISAPAGITLSRMTIRDCNNTGTSISAPWANTCRSGGGNTGIVFGTNLTAAAGNGTITCTGEAFAANQYAPTGRIEARINGTLPWTAAAAYPTWADTSSSGTFAALGPGTYDVRLTSGDGEQDTILAAFQILAGVSRGPSRCYISASVGI